MTGTAAARAAALTAALLCGGAGVSGAVERVPVEGILPGARLSREQVLAIRYPSRPAWSPDGERVAFLWDDGGVVDLFWVAAEGGPPHALTDAATGGGRVSGFDWAPEGQRLVYALGGDLFLYDFNQDRTQKLTDTEELEGDPAFSPAGDLVAFVRAGQPWLLSPSDLRPRQITKLRSVVLSIRWNPDGTRLAMRVADRQRVHEQAETRVADRLEFSGWQTSASDLLVVSVADGRVDWLEKGEEEHADQPAWSWDGRIAWQQVSVDAHRRRIFVADLGAGTPPRTLVDEWDKAWWSLTYLQAGPRWEPRGDRIAFLSDRDGWTHLYLVAPPASSATVPSPMQLTAGEFEVEGPAWDPGGGRLVVAANRGSASERGLYLVDAPATIRTPARLQPISTVRGTSTAAQWSPGGHRLLYLHADPQEPLDLWLQAPRFIEPHQLTDSWPAAGKQELITPQVIRFRSADGRLVPAQLLLPPEFDRGAKLPAIVWVHGGGMRQNRYGWQPMRVASIFYGLHQVLAQRGFVVLAVDYRGSIGYGREFRVASLDDLGGGDLDDLLAANRYLRGLENPEISHVGVWGTSYGGYLTLQALMTRVPAVFDSGISVAGVSDWIDWAREPDGLWIRGPMGSVDEHAELYRQRSVIHNIARLNRPLLILHGTADRTVPVRQSFRLMDALLREGKSFEVMIYPGETHRFTRRSTWQDAWRRVERFFDESLR
ncbi:MAG: prolyl oligopeptidase family serine peptidase [Acidobacteriota bacterium]